MLRCVPFILAGFTAPMQIETNPQSMLWLLPLTAAIAIVYKATKMTTITARGFAKEAVVLFCSMVVVVVLIALFFCGLAWLVT